MDLFAVHRYGTEHQQNDPDREQRILKRLNTTIERKKKKFKKDPPVEAESERSTKITRDDQHDELIQADEGEQEEEEDVPGTIGTIENDNNNNTSIMDLLQQSMGVMEKKPNDFMVLGGDDVFQKRKRVNMILPHWLANPTVISNDLQIRGQSIRKSKLLTEQLRTNLKSMDIKYLFPVQQIIIPWMLDVHTKPLPFRPRDICVSAATGSGKTLSYAIPIVQLLMNTESTERKIRALIILPVNELAVQVIKVFKRICHGTGLSCVLLSKFGSFKKEQQQLIEEFQNEYYSKVDVVVTTTGRLIEHLNSTKGFTLAALRFLVIDEADRIMEQINNNWLLHLNKHLKEKTNRLVFGSHGNGNDGGGGGGGISNTTQRRPGTISYLELSTVLLNEPHKMLFSATLSQDPEKLQNLNLFHPKLFTAIVDVPQQDTNSNIPIVDGDENEPRRGEFIGKYTTPAELTEKYCITELKLKPLTLYALIKENNWHRFLCFTNKGDSAHRLSYVLQSLFGEDMKIEELSAGLTPHVRNQVLLKFKSNKINGLICSDALARGIDVPDVDIVVSYDFPRHIKTYIHRIGRTARAGKFGTAITMLASHELKAFYNIIKDAGKQHVDEIKITTNVEEVKAKEYAAALKHLQNALQRENQIKAMKINQEKNRLRATGGGGHGGGTFGGSGDFIAQLQSDLQKTDFVNVTNDANVPESWKWENVTNAKNRRKEKKSGGEKRNKNKNKKDKITG